MVPAATRNEARSRLARAREYFAFAEIADGDANFANPGVSLCVNAGIAAADVVLLLSEHRRGARDGHERAPHALRRINQDSMARSLSRLLKLKPRAQYTAGESCSANDFRDALRDARRCIELASAMLNGEVNE
ncbi:hypothetical protein GCM10009808_15460 [Microbacterium sediminicola]|uniref:HEPN domain-containing protein n=1 Tax=Microbacterium sediminicola TaxID=415210 RepID=A0ABN2I591_9MICO